MSEKRLIFLLMVQTAALSNDMMRIADGGEGVAGEIMVEAISVPEADIPDNVFQALAEFTRHTFLGQPRPAWMPPAV